MTKILNISQIQVLVPALVGFALLAALFFAIPASAQVSQATGCVLVKDIKVSGITIAKGAIVNEGTAAFPTADVASGTAITPAEWGILCLLNTINIIADWVSLVVLILSTVLIIYAGFLWMTSGQNPENQEKAGKFIMAALVGFGIVILARVLPAIISGILL